MGAALNTVYNNCLTAYTPKGLTRYDTHKKSELRSVYNSIIKLNKDSPWYLPTTSRETQHYAVDLKENARQLHNTIARLGGLEEDGLLNKKTASSSNEELVSASYIGPQIPEGAIPEFEIEVRSLASPQENMGLFLDNAKTGLQPGTYSFDIAINDMNYEFQFSIGESETNRDIQDRLVRLINNSDIGIKASVMESDSKASLRLISESTGLPQGKSQIFSISDDHTSKQAGAVAYFGLDYNTKRASNAYFLINGEERTASANHFTVGKCFEIQLNNAAPEGETVHVGLKTDIESLTDNITQLVSGYNDFVKAAASYMESQAKSRQLVQELKGIVSVYGNSLESMGMNLTEEGTLQVDKDLLHQTAAQTTNIAQTFGYIKNFSNLLLRKSSQVSMNPMNYVEKTVVAYKNPGHNFVSPYAASPYSGMMFNGYC